MTKKSYNTRPTKAYQLLTTFLYGEFSWMERPSAHYIVIHTPSFRKHVNVPHDRLVTYLDYLANKGLIKRYAIRRGMLTVVTVPTYAELNEDVYD